MLHTDAPVQALQLILHAFNLIFFFLQVLHRIHNLIVVLNEVSILFDPIGKGFQAVHVSRDKVCRVVHLVYHQQTELLFKSLKLLSDDRDQIICNFASINVQTSFRDVLNVCLYFCNPLSELFNVLLNIGELNFLFTPFWHLEIG